MAKLRWMLVAVMTFWSVGALAQVPQVNPGVEMTMLAYRQLALGIEAMIKDKDAAVTQLRERLAQIDAYLKACGDRPGCTVPTGDAK